MSLSDELPPKQHAVTFNAVGNIISKSISPSLENLTIRDPPHLDGRSRMSNKRKRCVRIDKPGTPDKPLLVDAQTITETALRQSLRYRVNEDASIG